MWVELHRAPAASPPPAGSPIVRRMSAKRSAENTPQDPLWQRYELSVHELLDALDPAATVSHNTLVPGRLSQISRQVDVWLRELWSVSLSQLQSNVRCDVGQLRFKLLTRSSES
jgi:hypothetical protein